MFMKSFFSAVAMLVGASLAQVSADEITGKVIHHYTYVGAGYSYLHDVGDGHAHGVFGEASFEEYNFVLSVSGGHWWADDDLGVDADTRLWSVGTSLGYVFRFAENHLNIIPRFGGAYGETIVDVPGPSRFKSEAWFITPGATLSYALNNRLALAANYTYAYNLDAEEGDHAFSVGPRFALFERVGLNVSASFTDDDGFTGVTAGVELHF